MTISLEELTKKSLALAINLALKNTNWSEKVKDAQAADPSLLVHTVDPELDEGNVSGLFSENLVDWNVVEIKKKISAYSDQGKLSSDLIDLICKDGLCAPIEFEFLDYKETTGNTPYEKAKLALRIVSFFNSYGGYLVFGVAETESETQFNIVGIDASIVDIESMKAKIKEFTGERIQISALSLNAVKSDGKNTSVLFIHIPKRPSSVTPLHFLKDGPTGDNKKLLFKKEDVYYRRGDECIEAKGQKIFELNGERLNPYLLSEIDSAARMFRVSRISHNLPDRNFICSKFIGRDSIVNALWRWLGDDLSHVKVLAGEGGLGKTSIAFEFAERVSESKEAPFDQVVWLTAKEQQFNGFEDKYVKVPEQNYSSYEELLRAICEKLPFTAAELNGATVLELKRMMRKGLAEMPSLLIVDDVDSLSAEEQRQVLELGMILGDSPSRILLTTRFNQSYSADNVIKIEGLTIEIEYPAYLESLAERLTFSHLKTQDIEKIHAASSGSPLFTESLLRLLRWHNVGEAIALWKGERGSAVRSAALKREIELLSPEAKRILFAIASLGEASAVELCDVLGYIAEKIEHGLSELVALFLVAAPALASTPRYRVPENTRRLALDTTIILVTDRARLERNIADFRKQGDKKPTKDTRVAMAISQASSFLRMGNITSALATIKDARSRTQDHFDLLSYQATLNLKEIPPKIHDARINARKAFEKGCRKPEVFECWFESEWLAKNYVGALEAAEAALDKNSPNTEDWLIKKAAALASKASDQSSAGTIDGAVRTMFEASASLKQAIVCCRREDVTEWENRQHQLHDQIWVWGVNQTGLGRTALQIDGLEEMWRLGDCRITNQRRMLSAIDGMVILLERKLSSITSSQRNLAQKSITRAQAYFDLRNQNIMDDPKQKPVNQAWEILRVRAFDSISKHT
jgi:hypothetical protein